WRTPTAPQPLRPSPSNTSGFWDGPGGISIWARSCLYVLNIYVFLVILCLRVTQPGTFASGRRQIVPSPTRYLVSNLCRIVAACTLNPPPSPPPIPPQDILEH
ncbi:unnamed protein product, partial [Pylaiella littoralis]